MCLLFFFIKKKKEKKKNFQCLLTVSMQYFINSSYLVNLLRVVKYAKLNGRIEGN